MNLYLIVVDMQNDFIDGSLGTKEALHIVPSVVNRIRLFEGTVLFTQDTHNFDYLNTQEGKKLPVLHCIENTHGWQLHDDVKKAQISVNGKIFIKHTFGSKELAHFLLAEHQKRAIDSIEIIGLCTDICVISNALLIKSLLPEVPLLVDQSCCAGVTPASHLSALQTLAMCQVEVK